MYKNNFISFSDDQIKMVNASALAKQFNCSSMWVGKVLKLDDAPTNKKAIKIFEAAKQIVELYEKQSEQPQE
jgi:hypothetical protein